MTEPTTAALPPAVISLRHAKPRPLGTLLASAKRLTSRSTEGRGKRLGTAGTSGWQDDAWEMFDLVGEERFLAMTLAGRIAQAFLFVGEVGDDPNDDPAPTTNKAVAGVLDALGGSAAGRSQMILRLAVNLFVAGDGWLVGIPRHLLPSSLRSDTLLNDEEVVPITSTTTASSSGAPGEDLVISDLEWRSLSVSEISSAMSGEVTVTLGEGEGEKIIASPDDLYLIRIWRAHPRRAWEADSPTRSSLPVLREIVGLTMHISAQVDSRLAGAGVLIVPKSAADAIKATMGKDIDDDEDPFTEALMEAMIKPISDRASASAVVPLVITVPDEVTDKFQFLTFSKPIDTEARPLRDEAIRRLALGQDAPPELLLGVGGMNHWGAWLVREDVVTTHIEPPLALIADALTTQYLWPVLLDQGMSEEEVRKYVVWYDVSHMIIRPNRANDALTLYDREELTGVALREATGFSENDAPPPVPGLTDPIDIEALALAKAHPELFVSPGLPALREQLRVLYAGEEAPAPPSVPAPEPATGAAPAPATAESPAGSGEIPATSDQGANPTASPAVPPALAAAGLSANHHHHRHQPDSFWPPPGYASPHDPAFPSETQAELFPDPVLTPGRS